MTDTSGGASGGGTTPRSRTRGQIAIALTLALLGFLLATQLRSQQGLAQRLSIERESDLGQILSEIVRGPVPLHGRPHDVAVPGHERLASPVAKRVAVRQGLHQPDQFLVTGVMFPPSVPFCRSRDRSIPSRCALPGGRGNTSGEGGSGAGHR